MMTRTAASLCLCLLIAGCASSGRPQMEDVRASLARWETDLQHPVGKPAIQKQPASVDLSTSPLRLERVRDAVQTRNAELASLHARWQAALNKAPAVSGLPDPMVTVMAMGSEIETRNGPVEGSVQIVQRFPWFGKLDAAERAALAEAGRAFAFYKQKRLSIRSQITEAYYELYVVRRSLEITAENIAILERLEKTAQSKYAAGTANQQDVLKAQIELENLRSSHNDLLDREHATRARMNGLLNRPTDASLGEPILESRKPTATQGLDHALENSPAVAAARFNVLASLERIREAKLSYGPNWQLGAQYQPVGDTDLGGAVESGEDAWGILIGVEIPLWRGQRDAKVRMAESNHRATMQALQEQENRTAIQLDGRQADLRIALRQKELIEDRVLPRAEQALKASESGYENGKIDFLDLLDSEQKLLGYRLAKEKAAADVYIALARLEETLGVEK